MKIQVDLEEIREIRKFRLPIWDKPYIEDFLKWLVCKQVFFGKKYYFSWFWISPYKGILGLSIPCLKIVYIHQSMPANYNIKNQFLFLETLDSIMFTHKIRLRLRYWSPWLGVSVVWYVRVKSGCPKGGRGYSKVVIIIIYQDNFSSSWSL